MDDGKGNLEAIAEAKANQIRKNGTPAEKARLFTVGEEVSIRESKFRIDNISASHISLKILPN